MKNNEPTAHHSHVITGTYKDRRASAFKHSDTFADIHTSPIITAIIVIQVIMKA